MYGSIFPSIRWDEWCCCSQACRILVTVRVHKDHDCWAKELLEGLRFVDPSKDWLTHMQQLMPIENPKGVAGLAKQKFADSYEQGV
jgi:hypothetical protein